MAHIDSIDQDAVLPSLPLEAWKDTHDSLHMWVQIVSKIRLAFSPMVNHWWQTTLYVTTRGLTTSPIPCGNEVFQIDFDFIDHHLKIKNSRAASIDLPLTARPVADFYQDIMQALKSIGVEIQIWTTPVEVEERIPFEQDRTHTAYDPEYAHRFWRILLQADRVMKAFRGRFYGKASPSQLFWGSFDLASARFSGRTAPLIQSAYHVAKYVMQEAYSKEVSSCGFWPGVGLGEPAFYAYTYPEPPGYSQYPVQPDKAYYHPMLREFILPYEAVRTSDHWEADLLTFFQTAYEAGANLAGWDRQALEHRYEILPDTHP